MAHKIVKIDKLSFDESISTLDKIVGEDDRVGLNATIVIKLFKKLDEKYSKERGKTTRKKTKKGKKVITADDKWDFIQKHSSYFGMLYERIGGNKILSGKDSDVKIIADTARVMLGYSQNTPAVSIVQPLYNMYLKQYKF